MAPNVRVRDTWETESDETSHEDVPFVAVPSSVPPSPPLMSQLPELFLPHLPQHSLDPDSPNLHLLQRHRSSTIKPQVRSQSARSTLKVLQELEAEKSQRPLSIEERNPLGPIPETSLPEASTRAPKELPPLSTQSPLSPESLVQVTNEPTVVSAGGSRRPEITPRRRPTVRTSTWPPPTTTTHTTHRRDPGVLKLPGHEPEAPADLVLIHHDRAIDTHNQTGLNGIFVRDDSTSLTAEGATALILIGTCTVFLVFICFFFFLQKIRQQRIQRKVVEKEGGDVVKPQTTYEGPHSPLSLLPPALVHALALASQSSHKEEENPPTFLTMEPPFSNNSLGRLWFSVYYDYLTSNLVLKVLHARYPKGRGWSSNPGEVWVEAVVLSPLNSVMATANTGTRRASSAPVFQQIFRFKVDDVEVTQYLLRLTLYDRSPDQPGEKASGAVIVPLSSLDLCSQETLARDLQ